MGASLIISAWIVSNTFYSIRALDNVISVTGSARLEVTSDSAKWTTSISRTNITTSTLSQGYTNIANDLSVVKAFFAKNGIDESQLTISPVQMSEQYDYNQNNTANQVKHYQLMQTISIASKDVHAITALAKQTGDVASKGIIFSTGSLEYYYSKLAELRVNLLSAAIGDAKARATKIAESGGEKVGALRSASSGVVQVLPSNSVEVSDYGTYDTSDITKEVMVTVKATFSTR